jgi:hypothetical protein
MVLRFVEWAIGPSGVKVLDWLDQRGLWVPGLVLAITALAFAFPGPRERTIAWFGRMRRRLGLAPTPEEQARLAEMQARVRGYPPPNKGDSKKTTERKKT